MRGPSMEREGKRRGLAWKPIGRQGPRKEAGKSHKKKGRKGKVFVDIVRAGQQVYQPKKARKRKKKGTKEKHEENRPRFDSIKKKKNDPTP